jgi:outer membrane protein assembly factor BamB
MPSTSIQTSLSRTALIALGASLAFATTGCKKNAASTGAPAKPAAKVQTTAAPTDADGNPVARTASSFEALSALGYRPEWIGYPVMPRGRKVHFFDPFDDIVIVQEAGNVLTVMDAATGANRWTLNMGSTLAKFVGSIRNDIGDILCSSENEVLTLDPATGVIKARQKLARIANTRPALIGDLLIYGGPSGDVLAHSLTSGYKRWAYALDGAITAPAVKVGDSVAIVSQRGELVILEPRQGKAVGRGQLFGGLANNPVAEGDTVFFAGLDQSVWAFDEYGHAPKWRIRLEQPLRDQPFVSEGRLYISIPGEGLACLDASNGTRLWTTKGLSGAVVAIRNDRLIFWDGRNASSIDKLGGDVIDRVTLAGIDRLVADKPVDGNLYAYSLKGEVHKYSPKK